MACVVDVIRTKHNEASGNPARVMLLNMTVSSSFGWWTANPSLLPWALPDGIRPISRTVVWDDPARSALGRV